MDMVTLSSIMRSRETYTTWECFKWEWIPFQIWQAGTVGLDTVKEKELMGWIVLPSTCSQIILKAVSENRVSSVTE